ncbi:MAG: hypothetical protein CMG57_04370 [Candidatus Marinimicrobia bacterium]|nr:hypothetical protein [Candidatus Neomarinimicrobiota bacterium]
MEINLPAIVIQVVRDAGKNQAVKAKQVHVQSLIVVKRCRLPANQAITKLVVHQRPKSEIIFVKTLL